jgi:uncharacterized protein YndB with AHSA1/START domain
MSQSKLDFPVTAQGALVASGPKSRDAVVSVRIEAEVRRVLYALATPEYMEAWLQMPEVDRVECHSERRSFDRFRIDLFLSGRLQQSIYGSCLLSKPNRITYLWERDLSGSSVRSVVELCLLGGPTRCTLNLKHSGLSSRDETEWYSKMWTRSLEKLGRLIQGTAIISSTIGANTIMG